MTLLKDLSLILRAEGEYDKLIFYLNENFSKVLVKENGHETFNVMEKINEKLLNENKNEIGAFLKKLRGFKSVEEGIEKFVEDNVKSNFKNSIINADIRSNIDSLKLLSKNITSTSIEYFLRYSINFLSNHMFSELNYLYDSFKEILFENFSSNEDKIVSEGREALENCIKFKDKKDESIADKESNVQNDEGDCEITENSVLVPLVVLIVGTYNDYCTVLCNKVKTDSNPFENDNVDASSLINNNFPKLSEYMVLLINSGILEDSQIDKGPILTEESTALVSIIKEWIFQVIKWSRDVYTSTEPVDKSASVKTDLISKFLGVKFTDISELSKSNESMLRMYSKKEREDIIILIRQILI